MHGLVAVLVILFLIGLAFFFYFLPAIIAFNRQHHQRTPILLLNFFFGWTFLGWVAALIWSASHVSAAIRTEQAQKI